MVDKVGLGQPSHHILDVNQPRPPGDFLETGINFKKIGETMRRNLMEVKGMIYEDEFADLAARINIQGPTVIGLGGRFTQLMYVCVGGESGLNSIKVN